MLRSELSLNVVKSRVLEMILSSSLKIDVKLGLICLGEEGNLQPTIEMKGMDVKVQFQKKVGG